MLKVSVLTQNNNLQDDFSENLRDYLDIERINSQDCQKRTVKLLNQAYTLPKAYWSISWAESLLHG